MNQKDEKMKEIIRELAAEYFQRESNGTSLITITAIELRSRNSRATILFTVMPENQEMAALDFMTRQLSSFREYVSEHARIMRTPFFDVALDRGEKNRQRIDQLASSV